MSSNPLIKWWEGFAEKHPSGAKWMHEGGLFIIFSYIVTFLKYIMLQFFGRVRELSTAEKLHFPEPWKIGPQIAGYFMAWVVITIIVNSINCVWVAVASQLVPDFVYNIGTTVLNSGVSMVVFFVVNKIIFADAQLVEAK